MYNYSFETTYQVVEGEEGDTKYREEFLKAFNKRVSPLHGVV